ncbi:MAG: hypothetical protein R2834_20045 [Rhodothermales bacterium]
MTRYLFPGPLSAWRGSSGAFGLTPNERRIVLLSPWIIALIQALGIAVPATRKLALWMLLENRPVEMLTFVALFIGGLYSMVFAWKLRDTGEPILYRLFFLLFGVILLLIGMEEISWGQQFLRFDTPESWMNLNSQGETNLHNLPGLQGNSEYMRLGFGLAGLIGIALGRIPLFRPIATPALLFSWFLIISVHAGVDAYNDFHPIQEQFDYYMQRTSELVECMIGLAAFLYVWMHVRARSSA